MPPGKRAAFSRGTELPQNQFWPGSPPSCSGSRGYSLGDTGQREEDLIYLEGLAEVVPGQDLKLEVRSPKHGTIPLGCARSSEGPTDTRLKRLLHILIIVRRRNTLFSPVITRMYLFNLL